MNLAHHLARWAAAQPERPALFEGPEPTATYAEWAVRAKALAQHLQAAGLNPGDRVILFMRNHPRYLEILFGVWWMGGVVVPVNAKLHPKELQWIAHNAGARWAFISRDALPEEDAVWAGLERVVDVDSPEMAALLVARPQPSLPVADRAPDDTAWLFYTSGTTGRPKGVMITHRNLQTMALGYFVDVDAVQALDAIAYAAPMSHGAGLYALPHLLAGARHVVPQSGGFDAAELFRLGRQIGPLSLFAAPTIVKRLVDHAEAQGWGPEVAAQSFKTIVYGGAPMYAADIQRALWVMGPRFVQIYGQGESPMVGTALSRADLGDTSQPDYAARLASVGRAQSTVRVRVADQQGQEVALGEVGEVLLAGDSVMAGYWQAPEATAAALREGWLWTGDMGCLDAAGYLTLKDRSKDLIISGGSNIYPREIEEVLLQHPDVAEVAVVGAPDNEWGESVVAFVVARGAVAPAAAALDTHVVAHLARFKRPKRYVWVESLPKNNYGKVLKTALRERLQADPAGADLGQSPP